MTTIKSLNPELACLSGVALLQVAYTYRYRK